MRPHSALSFANSQLVADVASKAFTEADLDDSGTVDFAELYIAVLLAYDKINKVCPVHVKPPKKKQVQELLQTYDLDMSGALTMDEFRRVIRALVAGGSDNWRTALWWRITYLWGLKALLCPLVAYAIIHLIALIKPAAATWPQGPLAFLVELAFKLSASRFLL